MFAPNQVPPHILKNSPLGMQTKQLHVISHYTVPKSSSTPVPDPSPPLPPTLCKQYQHRKGKILRQIHSYVPDVQTISIFHVSPHQQHNWYQEVICINPHCAFCPSRTPHTSISPSYVLSFPNFSDQSAFFSLYHLVPKHLGPRESIFLWPINIL